MQHQTITHNRKIPHQTSSFFRYISLTAVFIALLLELSQTIHAQDSKTVQLGLLVNERQPPIFDELMAQVESKLGERNVALSVISDRSTFEQNHNYDLLVRVNVNQENSTSVVVFFRATREFDLPKSPILYPDEVSPLCCNAGLSSVLLNTFSLGKNNLDDIASFIAGLGLYQVDDYEGCEQFLSVGYSEVPNESLLRIAESVKRYVNFYRANCAIMRDDLELAVTLLESPTIGQLNTATINLAWTYLQLGNPDKAVELIADIEPRKDWDLLAHRAQLYNLAFRYDDAITDLNTAIDLSPTNPELYTLRGQTYLLLYEWDAVLADYNKALELDPTYADAYYYRGVLYYSILQTGQEMYTAALADFQRYLELAPEGIHAAEATRYATDIQTQINALNN